MTLISLLCQHLAEVLRVDKKGWLESPLKNWFRPFIREDSTHRGKVKWTKARFGRANNNLAAGHALHVHVMYVHAPSATTDPVWVNGEGGSDSLCCWCELEARDLGDSLVLTVTLGELWEFLNWAQHYHQRGEKKVHGASWEVLAG